MRTLRWPRIIDFLLLSHHLVASKKGSMIDRQTYRPIDQPKDNFEDSEPRIFPKIKGNLRTTRGSFSAYLPRGGRTTPDPRHFFNECYKLIALVIAQKAAFAVFVVVVFGY